MNHILGTGQCVCRFPVDTGRMVAVGLSSD